MKTNPRAPIITLFFFLLWGISSTAFFIFFPARVSYINSVDIANTPLSIKLLGSFFTIGNLFGFIRSFFGVVAFSFACISIGRIFLKTIRLDIETCADTSLAKIANIATCFITGNSIYSSVFILLAGFYKITSFIVILGISIGILIGLPQLKSTFGDFPALKFTDAPKWKKFIWLAMLVLGLTILTTTARISYDSSAIYFSNAKITAYTEHLKFFSNDTFVASSFQNSIQFVMLIQAFGDQSARMISWICGVVIIIFCLALGEKVGLSNSARVIALVLLLTSTAFIDLLGDGKVDLISTATAMATVYWMVTVFKQSYSNKVPLVFIGLLAGFSITGRPFNAFLLGLFIVLFYLINQFVGNAPIKQGIKDYIITMMWIGFGVSITGLFHLFVNWMIYKDTLAFLHSVSNINSASGPWDNNPKAMLALRLLYPFTVTFRNTPQSLGNISPLVIIFLPTLLIKKVRDNLKLSAEIKLISSIAATTITLWIILFFTVVEIRYVLYLWMIIFLLIAKIIETQIETANPILQSSSMGLIGCLLVFIVIRTGLISLATYSPIDQQGNPKCSDFILCDFFSEINQTAESGERVLTLTAFRYYLREDLFACSTSNEEYSTLKYLSYETPELFWEEVYRQGYSYIAYENDYTTRHLQFNIIPDPISTPKWIKLERIDKYATESVAAYKIIVIQPPLVDRNNCELNNRGIWSVITN
jgi:hypothetical protein